jgi:hypothetical protein
MNKIPGDLKMTRKSDPMHWFNSGFLATITITRESLAGREAKSKEKHNHMLNPRLLGNVLLLLAPCFNLSRAATLTVGAASSGCSNAGYTTIGAALAVAHAGDEIDICPALYPEQLVITKPVTLRGIGINGIQRVLLQPAAMTQQFQGLRL